MKCGCRHSLLASTVHPDFVVTILATMNIAVDWEAEEATEVDDGDEADYIDVADTIVYYRGHLSLATVNAIEKLTPN